jgi:hypothetical protein
MQTNTNTVSRQAQSKSKFDPLKAKTAIFFHESLSSSARLVALAIYDFWSRKNPRPFPSTTMLQQMTRLSRPTIIDAIRELAAADVLGAEKADGKATVFDLEPVTKFYRSPGKKFYRSRMLTGKDQALHRSNIGTGTSKADFTNQHQNGCESSEENKKVNKEEINFYAADARHTNSLMVKRALPKAWEPNQTHADRATALGLNLATERDHFRANADANANSKADWDAAFTAWLIGAKKLERKPTRAGNESATIEWVG